METNKDIEQLLLSIQKAFDVLVEKRTDFEAKDVKEALQGNVKTQTTLLSFVDEHISELSTHEAFDVLVEKSTDLPISTTIRVTTKSFID